MGLKVKDVMAEDVVTVVPNELIANAAHLMRSENVGCLVVLESDDTIAGILTDRDIAINCTGDAHDAKICHVSTHMTSPVHTVTPETEVLDAARILKNRRVRRLAVVQNNKMAGLLSYADIAAAMRRPLADLLELEGMDAARPQRDD